jgi:hypothetical protein
MSNNQPVKVKDAQSHEALCMVEIFLGNAERMQYVARAWIRLH